MLWARVQHFKKKLCDYTCVSIFIFGINGINSYLAWGCCSYTMINGAAPIWDQWPLNSITSSMPKVGGFSAENREIQVTKTSPFLVQ
ncbi:hypothetical protein CEXT_718651 [Caerostris extrusa]|uniref:Uncharacterized protein n=1 Tax=Caerostris extrusa TaxID=172846 RepID=A0AAV4USX4_CAEEX|nr:hypothetical protein CEXT_718651 [Caerostris extrusa]